MDTRNGVTASPGEVRFSRPGKESLLVHLAGNWKIGAETASADAVIEQIDEHPGIRSIRFEKSELDAWDSTLPAFVADVQERSAPRGIETIIDDLPKGVVHILKISSESKQLKERLEMESRQSLVASIGSRTLSITRSASEVLAFMGMTFLAFVNLFRGRARFRHSELGLLIYECGVQALPIVSLISILVGLILGFVGVIELQKFGAQIYIADLVGISMAREMGAMMTAIIMMGRTGAAYATQLGTMETNEEIDALKTLGIAPMEFLVMPRMLALTLMMPLLTIYADIMGIIGGGIVGVFIAEIPVPLYYAETVTALTIVEFAIGVTKSAVYAVLIALSGCFYGMHADRSAMAVGNSATRSVVLGIVLIVIADGIFAVLTNMLNI